MEGEGLVTVRLMVDGGNNPVVEVLDALVTTALRAVLDDIVVVTSCMLWVNCSTTEGCGSEGSGVPH